LSHLRDSGSIEQDADKILFIHRPREGGEELEVESGTGVKTTIVVAKNRNGPTGNASLVFVKNCLRFESNPGYE
jgi:replicative DNA helicase